MRQYTCMKTLVVCVSLFIKNKMRSNSNGPIKGLSVWAKQTPITKPRRTSVLLLFIVHLIAVLIQVAQCSNVVHGSEDEICSTCECFEVATKILRSMDQSIDPCEDFYEFACGNFQREATIPGDEDQAGPLQDLDGLVKRQLKAVFEETSVTDEEKPFKLLKKFYRLCLITENLEDTKQIKSIIKDLGGWPMVEGNTWNESSFDWQNCVYKLKKKGLNIDTFINIDVDYDIENSSQRSIFLDQVELEINSDDLLKGLDKGYLAVLVRYIFELAKYFGASSTVAAKDIHDLLNFYIQLANISLTYAEHSHRTMSFRTVTLLELQRQYPSVNWLELLNEVIDDQDHLVKNEQRVSIVSPKYIQHFGDVLKKSSKRVQANYVIFKVLNSLELFLPKALRNSAHKYNSATYGSRMQPRWKECVKKATEMFDIAAGALYVRRYFKDLPKQDITEMILNIKNAFIKILEDTKWIDASTKKKSIEKVLAITSHVGYSDEFLDGRKLEDYYAELQIGSDNILEFLGNVSVFEDNKSMRLLGKSVNKTDWTTRHSVADADAEYIDNENSIQFPAAFLQDFVFSRNRLRFVNYGIIGCFIGHEITHGFTDEGRKYDKYGNLVNWWSSEANDAFAKRADCIIKQYSNYNVPEIDEILDGKLTQDENIADNGGLNAAYIAYNTWTKNNGPEPKLPGLSNYTVNQLFWISAATIWCSKQRKESLQESISDVHSLNRLRVIGPFSNSDYFATDFQCPVGSKMNPRDKCRVW